MGARVTIVAVVLASVLASHSAGAEPEKSDEPFRLGGSLRTIAAGTILYDYPPFFGEDNGADGLSQTILRLVAAGRPREWLDYETHGVQEVFFSTATGAGPIAPVFAVGSARAMRYRALEEAWDWADEEDLRARLSLDRARLRLSLGRVDVTLGRQAVTFGEAHFWNPLDVFLPFGPAQLDRDYKAGVDAVRVDVSLGALTRLTLVGAAGRKVLPSGTYAPGDDATLDASWYGSALLARALTAVGGWEVTAQGGKVYGGWQVGGGASGEMGGIELRGEAAHLFAMESERLATIPQESEIEDAFTLVAGAGHRFDNSLHLQAEYLYNGAGDPGELDAAFQRVASGVSFQAGRHVAGLAASYEILPILEGSLGWIVSLSDGSSLVQPGLVLSAADEVEVVAGAAIAQGERPDAGGLESELGTYPSSIYVEVKVYF